MIFRGFLASFAAAAVFVMIGALGTPANAAAVSCLDDDCTVSDGGANIRFDARFDTLGVPSSGGDWELDDFDVGGISNLNEEEWHICIVSCFGDLNRELDNVFTLDSATADETTNTISITLTSPDLALTIDHVLECGPGSGTLMETLTLSNLSDSSIDVVLSEYDDFDLNGFEGNDTVSFDPDTGAFTQTAGDVTLTLTSSEFDFFNLGECCEFSQLEDNLVDGHLPGDPDTAGITSFGPDDVAFATEYDITLSAFESDGDSITITKVKTLSIAADDVPEPATLTLFGLGLAGLGLMRRRRRSRVASIR